VDTLKQVVSPFFLAFTFTF